MEVKAGRGRDVNEWAKILTSYLYLRGLIRLLPGLLGLGLFFEAGHLGGPALKMEVFLEVDIL